MIGAGAPGDTFACARHLSRECADRFVRSTTGEAMIRLGCFDGDVQDSDCKAYLRTVEELTRLALANVKAGPDKVTLQKYLPEPHLMSVAEVQQGLKAIGFFTAGKV